MINHDLVKELELEEYISDLQNIENQYLNLIYNPMFDIVMTRDEYDKVKDLIEWTCAICHKEILINKRRYDVENFVCDKCVKEHNNKNRSIDIRILNSRTKLYKEIEDRLYKELEDNLCKGKREVL